MTPPARAAARAAATPAYRRPRRRRSSGRWSPTGEASARRDDVTWRRAVATLSSEDPRPPGAGSIPPAPRYTRGPPADAIAGHARCRPARSSGRRRRRQCWRRRSLDRPAWRARRAPSPRADRPAHRPWLPVPRARSAGRRRFQHDDAAASGIVAGIGRIGRRRRDHCRRPVHQGRHLLPDDGQKASPGRGDRPREPTAVRLSR